MTLILKQSTSIDIRMGPFVDATDAVTPETGITLGAADQAEVLKANGAGTVTMGGTFAAVTGADGWYDYTVATGDVDTVGEVVFVVQDASVCRPVFVRALVVEEDTYEFLYASGASPVADILTTAMTESYAADGVAPTLAQAIFMIMQQAGEFAISDTTITVKKLDGSTPAATFTLDDATNPTSRTRAT